MDNILTQIRSGQVMELTIAGVKVPVQLAAAEPTEASHLSNLFVQRGKVWMVRYARQAIYIPHSIGLHYIQTLLRHPHVEVHVNSMAQSLPSPGEAQNAFSSDDNLELAEDSPQAVLDEDGRKRLMNWISEEKSELAQLLSDPLDVEAQEEAKVKAAKISQVERYLHEQGFGRHARVFQNRNERLRKSVRAAIARIIQAIATEHPTLSKHFLKTVHTGYSCRYSPDDSVAWEFEDATSSKAMVKRISR